MGTRIERIWTGRFQLEIETILSTYDLIDD